MLALATPSEASLSLAQKRLAPTGNRFYDADWLSSGLAKKFYRARELQRNGKPLYVAFYHIDDQNFLSANAGAFVGDGKADPHFWAKGLEMLALEEKCRGVRFQTARRGLVEKALADGYEIEGVMVVRDFNKKT